MDTVYLPKLLTPEMLALHALRGNVSDNVAHTAMLAYMDEQPQLFHETKQEDWQYVGPDVFTSKELAAMSLEKGGELVSQDGKLYRYIGPEYKVSNV